jgi:hypothetical protein
MESVRSPSVAASPFALTIEELLDPVRSDHQDSFLATTPAGLEVPKGVEGNLVTSEVKNVGQRNRRKNGRKPVQKVVFPSFSGGSSEDYVTFRYQFLTAIESYKIPSKETPGIFRRCITGKAAEAAQKLLAQKGTIHHLLHRCDIRFLPPGHPIVAQYQLGRARQTGKETVRELHTRITVLWGKAYPGLALDFPAAYKNFFTGLKDNKIRTHLLLYPPYSWDVALCVAEYKEKQLIAEGETNPLLKALLTGSVTPPIRFPFLTAVLEAADFPQGPSSLP